MDLLRDFAVNIPLYILVAVSLVLFIFIVCIPTIRLLYGVIIDLLPLSDKRFWKYVKYENSSLQGKLTVEKSRKKFREKVLNNLDQGNIIKHKNTNTLYSVEWLTVPESSFIDKLIKWDKITYYYKIKPKE